MKTRNVVLELLERMVNIPSPTGQESAVVLEVEQQLTNYGLTISRQAVDDVRFNLVAFNQETEPAILLCTHLDTVLPFRPFSRDGDTCYGRGTCDAKGAAAAMCAAAGELLAFGERRFGLLFVVGEEKSSDGAKKAASLDIGSRYVVLGEPTGNKLASAQKGTIVFRLHSFGQAGHSAYPGDSAVHKLVALLDDWLQKDWGMDRELGPTTLNIGRIQGGTGSNVIAAEAQAEGIFRISTSVTEVETQLQSTLPPGIRIEILSAAEPLELFTLPDHETITVSFGSDAAYLNPLGRVIMCGPGSIQDAHSEEEKVGVEELHSATDLYVTLVRRLLETVERD